MDYLKLAMLNYSIGNLSVVIGTTKVVLAQLATSIGSSIICYTKQVIGSQTKVTILNKFRIPGTVLP